MNTHTQKNYGKHSHTHTQSKKIVACSHVKKKCTRDFEKKKLNCDFPNEKRIWQHTDDIHKRTLPYRYLECSMLRWSCARSDAKITKMAPPVQKNMPRTFLAKLRPLSKTSEPMTRPMIMEYTGIQAISKEALVAAVNRSPYMKSNRFIQHAAP